MAGTVLVFGCDPPFGAVDVPDVVARPTTIGVMADAAYSTPGISIVLEDGREFLIPHGATQLTGAATAGALLITGEGPSANPDGGTWYASLRRTSDCYFADANGEIRGDRLALSFGFSVELSERWHETNTRFINSPAVGFCLDDEGRAMRPYSSAGGS